MREGTPPPPPATSMHQSFWPSSPAWPRVRPSRFVPKAAAGFVGVVRRPAAVGVRAAVNIPAVEQAVVAPARPVSAELVLAAQEQAAVVLRIGRRQKEAVRDWAAS